MRMHFLLSAISALVYYLSFLCALGTVGYIYSVSLKAITMSVPWYQWPFECLAQYFVYLINSIIDGNLRYYLSVNLIISITIFLYTFFHTQRYMPITVLFIALITNLLVAYGIDPNEGINPFLSRQAALVGTFLGVPFSIWSVHRVSARIRKTVSFE